MPFKSQGKLWPSCCPDAPSLFQEFLLADGIHFHAVLFSYLPDCHLAARSENSTESMAQTAVRMVLPPLQATKPVPTPKALRMRTRITRRGGGQMQLQWPHILPSWCWFLCVSIVSIVGLPGSLGFKSAVSIWIHMFPDQGQVTTCRFIILLIPCLQMA